MKFKGPDGGPKYPIVSMVIIACHMGMLMLSEDSPNLVAY